MRPASCPTAALFDAQQERPNRDADLDARHVYAYQGKEATEGDHEAVTKNRRSLGAGTTRPVKRILTSQVLRFTARAIGINHGDYATGSAT